jgi:hypothetical protein
MRCYRFQRFLPEDVFDFERSKTEANFIKGIVGTQQDLSLRYSTIILFFAGNEPDCLRAEQTSYFFAFVLLLHYCKYYKIANFEETQLLLATTMIMHC